MKNILRGLNMKIAICDDDIYAMAENRKYILDYFHARRLKYPEIFTYTNGTSLISHADGLDLVFLDIEMTGINGIDTGKILKKLNKDLIIFVVTSYLEYLDDAMRFHVFRYLSKPLDKKRLFQNLDDAIQQYYSANRTISIETKDEIHNVSAHDIIFIEVISRKVLIHTTEQEFISAQPLSYWISLTNPLHSFYQTHKSYLVNMEHISRVQNDRVYLYNNQFQASLTVRNRTEFKKSYLIFQESIR